MSGLSNSKTESTSLAKIIELKKKLYNNTLKSDGESLSPIEKAQFLQTKAYEKILNIGTVLNKKYSEDVKNNLNSIFKEKHEIVNKRIYERHRQNVECLLSELKTKYELELLKYIEDTKERFKKYYYDMNMEAKNKCEEKLKQLVADMKKRAEINLKKSITVMEKYLNREFEYVEEQNLAEHKEYYLQLLMYYELKFKNNLDDMKKKYEENYQFVKNRIVKKNMNDFNSTKLKLNNKLDDQKVEINHILPILHNIDEKEKKNECFKKQKANKQNELNWTNQQLEYFKDKIKSVLNNYSNAVTLMEKQRFGYVLDKEQLFQKYLCQPTAIELEHVIQDTE